MEYWDVNSSRKQSLLENFWNQSRDADFGIDWLGHDGGKSTRSRVQFEESFLVNNLSCHHFKCWIKAELLSGDTFEQSRRRFVSVGIAHACSQASIIVDVREVINCARELSFFR